jgi:hypothetical protein
MALGLEGAWLFFPEERTGEFIQSTSAFSASSRRHVLPRIVTLVTAF